MAMHEDVEINPRIIANHIEENKGASIQSRVIGITPNPDFMRGCLPIKHPKTKEYSVVYNHDYLSVCMINVAKNASASSDAIYRTDPMSKSDYISRRSYFNTTGSIPFCASEPNGNRIQIDPIRFDIGELVNYEANKLAEILSMYESYKNNLFNKFIIREELSVSQTYATHLIDQLVNNRISEEDQFLFALASSLNNHWAYSPMQIFEERYYVVVDYLIDPKWFAAHNSHQRMINGCGILLHLGNFDNCPHHPAYLPNADDSIIAVLNEENIQNGHWILAIQNNNPGNKFYYHVGNDIHYFQTVSNDQLPDGIYVVRFEKEKVSDTSIDEKGNKIVKIKNSLVRKKTIVIPLNQAEDNGFYHTMDIAKARGNIDAQNKLELARIQSEKLKVESELNKVRSQSESEKIERERELLESTRILKEKEIENQRLKFEYEKALQDMKLNSAKYDHDAKKVETDLDIEKAKVVNYYTERSYDRKDTSEMIKIVPGIIGGAVGILGTILAFKATGLAAITSSAISFPTTISIVAATMFFSSKTVNCLTTKAITHAGNLVRKTGSVIYEGGKSLICGTGRSIGYVAEKAYNGLASTGSFLCDSLSSVGDFIGGIFSY